ncbi:MAG TPA: helix-turn-helix domain-containing protein [Steroidobacter sp.]|uniref:helix-turn-helix domain-containing protein n=1 Tax=Steroidobacter sp. TaxID=1978227 RepID=UPI002ED8D039
MSLYTLGTYMDRDGYAWPSQSLWAKGSRVTERTIRRHMDRAVGLGWLAVETAGRTGQGWRHYAYRACVPDHLLLDDRDESISDALTAQNGGIEPGKGADTIVSSRQAKGADTAMSSPNVTCGHPTHERADIQSTTCGHSYVQNVRTQLCPTNSRSETPAYRTPKEEAQRFAPSAPDFVSQGKNPERRPQRPFPESPASASRPSTEKHIASLREWVAKQKAEEQPKRYSEEDDRQLLDLVRKNIAMGIDDDQKIQSQLYFYGSDERIRWAIDTVRREARSA